MEKMTMRKDFLLIGILVLVGLVFGLVLLLTRKDGKSVEIRVSGTETQVIPLSKSGRYEIQGKNGVNVLVIENGKAHMEEASCPDQICVEMGEIDTDGQSIICLPNEIVVAVTDSKKDSDSKTDTESETDTDSKADEQEIDVVAGGKQ